MNILLLDDHAILLDGLEAVLNAEPGFNVMAKVSDPEMALAYLKGGGVDLVITDQAMPGVDGASFIRCAKRLTPDIRILMLSMHDEPNIVREVINAGADGYVLKKYAQQELVFAIHTVVADRPYWSREIGRALLEKDRATTPSTELTDREAEVLKLLVDELSSREIAGRLFISERTVETHRKNLLRKTGALNTVGLVKYAYQHKLV